MINLIFGIIEKILSLIQSWVGRNPKIVVDPKVAKKKEILDDTKGSTEAILVDLQARRVDRVNRALDRLDRDLESVLVRRKDSTDTTH